MLLTIRKRHLTFSMFLFYTFITIISYIFGIISANAASPVNGGIYQFTNKNSRLVLEVQDGSLDDGANVQQWESNGSDCQKWRLEYTDSGYYHIINVHSGKLLEVHNASTNKGANVAQWGSTNHSCQEWQFQSADDGYYILVNRNSGQVVDVWEWSTEMGGNIAQWVNTGGENQQWRLSDASMPSSSNADGFASVNAFGQNGTTGGAGGEFVTVTNQTDLEKYASASSPFVIQVQGTITISPFGKEVQVADNKTIIGLGNNATISQGGFILDPANNVIIQNLTIRDSYVEGDWDGKTQDFDAIQVDNSHHIWIDHCHLTHCGDGLIDLREATSYVTVSWTIFSNHNKSFGLGWTDDTEYKVTIHHCWFNGTNQRNPSFDNGMGHLYNNYLLNCSSYGNYSRGVARLVIENSYFENTDDPYFMDSNAQLVSNNNIVVDCTGRQESGGSAFNPSNYYDYTLDNASDVPNILRNNAGPQ